MALATGVPAYVVFRVAAQWIYSKEGFSGHDDPTWIGIGYIVLGRRAVCSSSSRSAAPTAGSAAADPVPGRIVAALSSVYLVLLAVAWLAMSGKWS